MGFTQEAASSSTYTITRKNPQNPFPKTKRMIFQYNFNKTQNPKSVEEYEILKKKKKKSQDQES